MGEAQVRTWLREALPSPLEKQIRKAQAAIDAHNPAAARTMLEDVLREAPNHADARLMLAALLAFEDLPRAAALVEGLEPGRARRSVHSNSVALSIGGLAARRTRAPDAARRSRGALLWGLGAGPSGHHRRPSKGPVLYERCSTQVGCRHFFHSLGPQHPLTQRHRRTFDMWLY